MNAKGSSGTFVVTAACSVGGARNMPFGRIHKTGHIEAVPRQSEIANLLAEENMPQAVDFRSARLTSDLGVLRPSKNSLRK